MKTNENPHIPDQRLLLAAYAAAAAIWVGTVSDLQSGQPRAAIAISLFFSVGFAALAIIDFKSGRRMLAVFPGGFGLVTAIAALAQWARLL